MTVVKKPKVVITMGDPSGVGPEVILKGLTSFNWEDSCLPIVIGSPLALERERKNLGLDCSFEIIDEISRFSHTKSIQIFPGDIKLSSEDIAYRNLSEVGARAVIEWIKIAVSLVTDGFADAVCTAPLNKAVLKNKANFKYPGHTEFLAYLTNTKRFVMMLAGERLRVSLVTIHCPLARVPELLSVEGIIDTIQITAKALSKDFGIEKPRLAVAGLNPHAGEDGKFGTEETEIIAPAIEKASEKGIDVFGPCAPDTVYHYAYHGKFDAVISMYHDQGLIPLKLVHFFDAVNVTLGLPIIRTSVDHGTAYDIAGKGIADPRSFIAALRLATKMALSRYKDKKMKDPVCDG